MHEIGNWMHILRKTTTVCYCFIIQKLYSKNASVDKRLQADSGETSQCHIYLLNQ